MVRFVISICFWLVNFPECPETSCLVGSELYENIYVWEVISCPS